MKAMIFAAGVGSRLKPFTDAHPKALVEIGGRPILGLVIAKLAAAGVDKIIINVHHFAEQIYDYLSAHDFGVDIAVSDESAKLLDTGGGIVAAAHLLSGDEGEPLIVHNADILTDFDIRAMIEQWRRTGPMALLMAEDRDTSRKLLFDNDMKMRGWINSATHEVKPPTLSAEVASACGQLAFGGVHILSPEILSHLCRYAARMGESNPKFSITDFYISQCSALDIRAYRPPQPYRWYDVGKPETLQAARAAFANDK